jgi:hypothetical protein
MVHPASSDKKLREMNEIIETDYLVVGSGAVGMAFADTILAESDAHIVMVDRFPQPGGHWNVAYPFVRLHQPSQFYGVPSSELSKGHIDQVGLNRGLFELASGAEVLAYFDEVMRQIFLPTGRMDYYPMCNYVGEGVFESRLSGNTYKVHYRKKLVDCTYLNTSVPALHAPNFQVDDGVQFIPVNDLVRVKKKPGGYVIIGGGKTGIDACLWLLEQGVDPNEITWIVSRDGWLIDRQNTQPSEAFFASTIGTQAKQAEAISRATSISDLFDQLEDAGVLVRIHKDVRPTMFHGATVSQMELGELRRIQNVIRLGKVKRLKADEIVLERGSIPVDKNYVHIDCSASAITNLHVKPVFEGNTITPQTVRAYQPVFSASHIAHVELHYSDDQKKNELSRVVPLPNRDIDWIPMTAAQLHNQFTWSKDKNLRQWLRENRLDGFSRLVREVDRADEEKMSILHRLRMNTLPAMIRLQELDAELNIDKYRSMSQAQFQVRKDLFFKNRLVDTQNSESLDKGQIRVQIEKFAYTANNITYAAVGDMIGYWKFFPPAGKEVEGWGVIPVWGFARVTESKTEGIRIGERLFGYFPPATSLTMTPGRIGGAQFFDVTPHRMELPSGYNIYRRVDHEAGYDQAFDRERMMLYPLHLTAFCIWHQLKSKDWYGAEQIVILSASSKTSTGLGYALKDDSDSPKMIGITSAKNMDFLDGIALYDGLLSYEEVEKIDQTRATLIVDMSGNAGKMAEIHKHLGDQMKFTLNVGLTHWTDTKPVEGVNTEKSTFFFAPSVIQELMKEWGSQGFEERSSSFMRKAAIQTRSWLDFREIHGLAGLAEIHPSVCEGELPANEGLVVVM